MFSVATEDQAFSNSDLSTPD